MPKRQYCVEFYDHGQWNEWANTKRNTKTECVIIAQEMNKKTKHIDRKEIFGGHRFRVRAVKER